MVKSIVRHIIAKEVYNKHKQHRGYYLPALTFSNLGTIAWLIILLAGMWIVVGAFIQRYDVMAEDIKAGEPLYLNQWETYIPEQVPFYVMDQDTNFYYNQVLPLDSSTVGTRLLGTAVGPVLKRDDDTDYYVEIAKSDSIKLEAPKAEDFRYNSDSSYSKEKYVLIDHIRLANTKEPESRWFQYLLVVCACAYFVIKTFGAISKIFKSTIPVYGEKAIQKRDRRYKGGYKTTGYTLAITRYEPMTAEEKAIHKKQQIAKTVFYLAGAILTAGLIYYYNNS